MGADKQLNSATTSSTAAESIRFIIH